MSDFMFRDFDEVSAKQWKQKIQYDLKGADYNETLIWQSGEGVNVKPFYHADDFKEDFQPIPGHPQSWNIAQKIFIDDEKIANNIAMDALNRGAESIIFSAEKEFDIHKTFENFPFETAPIYFEIQFLSEAFHEKLIQFFSNKNATVFYNIDVIGNLARTGNWFHNLKKDHEILDAIFQKHASQNILSVDATLYQNGGATTVQQLAYALGHANEYLNHLAALPLSDRSRSEPESSYRSVSETESGNHSLNKTENASRSLSGAEGSGAEGTRAEGTGAEGSGAEMTFKLAIGPNYFFEIAKIRALRKLYAALAKEYGTEETCHIIATPSKRNKTLFDYNVNLLRSTTECMSAILGGADTVCNLPYDSLYHKSNEFGERISRNQLLILKHESYFDTVSNPADGTYYIESLTDELAEKALQLFKEIEKGGGFLQQLKERIIQKKIKESAEKKQQLFDSGALKLLGTNYHPNKNDRMKQDLELFPFIKHNPVKTLIAPILERRLAESTEQERLNMEQ